MMLPLILWRQPDSFGCCRLVVANFSTSIMGKSVIPITLQLLKSGLTEFEKDGILITTFIEINEENVIIENSKIISSWRYEEVYIPRGYKS